jgi:hypothetical protein
LRKQFEKMETIIKQLKEIAGKTANQVTKADKDFIREYASQYGVELPKDKPNCKSCYVDAAVQIYKAIKDAEPKPTERKYILRDGVDVIWRGIRINEASVTDELAEKWIAIPHSIGYTECINNCLWRSIL